MSGAVNIEPLRLWTLFLDFWNWHYHIYICFMFYTIFHQTFQKFDCNLGFVGDYGRTEKYRCSACNSRWRTKIVIWGLRCLWKQLLAENWMHNTQSTCSVCRYSTKIHTIIEKKNIFGVFIKDHLEAISITKGLMKICH